MVDLNADVGEDALTASEEHRLLAVVTSASVSGGAHAGSLESITRVVEEAVRAGVVIGAHPSYPDRVGFGRRAMEIEVADLEASIRDQIATVSTIADRSGGRVAFVKPHGALYHRAGVDATTALLVARAAADAGVGRLLLAAGAPGGEVARAAGVAVAGEAFADRAYRADGSLVDRADDGAVLDDPEIVVAQALGLALNGTVQTVEGATLELRPDSLCIHGDTAGAAEAAEALRRALEAAGVVVAPFAS